MKALYILLFIPTLFFSQNKKDTARSWYEYEKAECEEQNRKDKIEYYKLKNEADEMDFGELARIIINDLDKKQFTRKYINFRYGYSTLSCGVIDDHYDCIKEYNLMDPFYSRRNWTAADLKYLGSVFKDKVIIPSYVSAGFGYEEGFYSADSDSKSVFSSFKKGKMKGKEREFYYFAKKDISALMIAEDTKMDFIFLDFQNLMGHQVKVTQYINDSKTVKVFEYENGKWVKNE